MFPPGPEGPVTVPIWRQFNKHASRMLIQPKWQALC
jgi:hypothetical protein